MDDGSRLPILISVLLLAGAVYFALAETAFSACSRTRMKAAAERGEHGAKEALFVLDHFERAITTMLIGTNLCHLFLSALVTMTVTRRWGLSLVTASTILTTLIVFFAGEMLPKSIAKKFPERLAKACAGSLRFFMGLFLPFSAVLTKIGETAAKVSRREPELSVTEDELYDIIEDMTEEGSLDEEQGELISSALQFGDLTVESVLTPRMDVAALDADADGDETLGIIKAQNHSRLPVYEGSVDKIVGFISQKEFFKRYLTRKEGENIMLRDIVQDIIFAPHLMKISDIMKQMQKEKIHMAVVLDQYGGTLGIVTLEDILEQLVGEIWDENDEIVAPVTFVTDTVFHVNGDVSLNDFRRYWHNRTGSNPLIDSNARTVGGWILELFGKIPETQESVKTADFNITVLKVSDRRIKKISFQVIEKEE